MFTVKAHLELMTNKPYEWGVYNRENRVAICKSKQMATRITRLLNLETKSKPRHGKSIGCRFTKLGGKLRDSLCMRVDSATVYCQLLNEFARLDPCDHFDCQPCGVKSLEQRCGACRNSS